MMIVNHERVLMRLFAMLVRMRVRLLPFVALVRMIMMFTVTMLVRMRNGFVRMLKLAFVFARPELRGQHGKD